MEELILTQGFQQSRGQKVVCFPHFSSWEKTWSFQSCFSLLVYLQCLMGSTQKQLFPLASRRGECVYRRKKIPQVNTGWKMRSERAKQVLKMSKTGYKKRGFMSFMPRSSKASAKAVSTVKSEQPPKILVSRSQLADEYWVGSHSSQKRRDVAGTERPAPGPEDEESRYVHCTMSLARLLWAGMSHPATTGQVTCPCSLLVARSAAAGTCCCCAPLGKLISF